jgi:hypothetical protein
VPLWKTATPMPGTAVVSSSDWTRVSTAARSDQFGRLSSFCRHTPEWRVPPAVSYLLYATSR